MSASPRWVGEGFALRPFCLADAPALLRHANDAEVARYTSHRFPHPFTEADAAAFLHARLNPGRSLSFAIEVDGEAAGGIGAHPGEGIDAHSAELGYWLGRSHWGRGLMTRVVALFWPLAMRECRLYRLYGRVTVGNEGSMRVLEANGFVREGVMRAAVFKHGRLADSVLFARTQEHLDD